MTIEVERTKSEFFGLKKTLKTRVLEFRGWTQRVSSSIVMSSRPDLIVLHMGFVPEGEILPDRYIFARPISEDDLEVRTTSHLMEVGEHAIYSGEGINDANLVSDDGERIKWRKTEFGDYPPLEPGQELRPIQQSLKLI